MKKYEDIILAPVKSFFVSMLTRDIQLEDSILDLLDNSVDGILRSIDRRITKNPYDGYKAEIFFDKESFCIIDNCGGIPWELHEYAFRMGRDSARPTEGKGTVGVYGIGMKRAVFKIGKYCLISTQNDDNRYEVEIDSDWIENEEMWTIPVRESKKGMKEDGTTIVIRELYESIRNSFGKEKNNFKNTLHQLISTHYAFILDKGFKVSINGHEIYPKPTKLLFSNEIKPFVYKTKIDGVEIFLTVGLTRALATESEMAENLENNQYSSKNAGWTVICNDRAVLYSDKSELTGWGEAGVARYHTQFIAISGVVEFKSDDPGKLPTTTTKRGIDTSSPIYLQAKNKMREGMSIFIAYTNKWKGRENEAKKNIITSEPKSFSEIKKESKKLKFNKVSRNVLGGEQYKPILPMPKVIVSKNRRISFVKDVSDIKKVSEYLFDNNDTDPSDVGERCFDKILKDAE